MAALRAAVGLPKAGAEGSGKMSADAAPAEVAALCLTILATPRPWLFVDSSRLDSSFFVASATTTFIGGERPPSPIVAASLPLDWRAGTAPVPRDKISSRWRCTRGMVPASVVFGGQLTRSGGPRKPDDAVTGRGAADAGSAVADDDTEDTAGAVTTAVGGGAAGGAEGVEAAAMGAPSLLSGGDRSPLPYMEGDRSSLPYMEGDRSPLPYMEGDRSLAVESVGGAISPDVGERAADAILTCGGSICTASGTLERGAAVATDSPPQPTSQPSPRILPRGRLAADQVRT